MIQTHEDLTAHIEEFKGTYADIAEDVYRVDVKELFKEKNTAEIFDLIEKYNSAARASLPECPLVPVNLRPSFSINNKDELQPVTIRLSSKPGELAPFAIEHHLHRVSSQDSLKNFFEKAYVMLIEFSAIHSNLTALNEMLASLTEDVNYSVSFDFGTKVVERITDEEVVFSIHRDRIWDLEKVIVFQEPVEMVISEEDIQEAFDREAAAFVAAGSTVGLVADPTPLVKYFMLNHRRKAIRLIEESCTTKLDQAKRAKTPREFRYDHDGVFAILTHDDDSYTVDLSPISKKTLERVDVDVIAAIQ